MKFLRNQLAMTSDDDIPPSVLHWLQVAQTAWKSIDAAQKADDARSSEDHGGASDLSEVRDETWTHPKL